MTGHTHSCVVRIRHGRHTTRVEGDPCVVVPCLSKAAAAGRWSWSRPGLFLVHPDVVGDLVAALESAGVRVETTGHPRRDLCDCAELLRTVLAAEEIT